ESEERLRTARARAPYTAICAGYGAFFAQPGTAHKADAAFFGWRMEDDRREGVRMATEPSLPSVAERGIADARDGRTDSAEAGGRRKPCGEHGWVAAGPDGRTEPASGEPSDREAILDLVRLAVRRHAGGATAVLLAGSAAGGTPLAAGCLPDSDLDVVTFTEKGRSR